MKSTDRILTTHVGSLPRPQAVVDLLFAQDRGETYDSAKFEETMRRGVAGAIAHQVESGDIVSDGEMSKIARMKAAIEHAKVEEGFMNAVSPGTIAVFQPYEYYPSYAAYMEALVSKKLWGRAGSAN